MYAHKKSKEKSIKQTEVLSESKFSRLSIIFSALYYHVLSLVLLRDLYIVHLFVLNMLFASTVLNYRIHTFLRSDYLLSILGKI